ncbi:ribonuclease P protein component [Marinoscillum sp. 108]|jgi:ribonuclease P protein component|uniref:Ribonuclease P protein component n=1 Tax=Marinoscillum luteum TaxID=861051 RepID=A0ABW7N604_9BACT|nr:ribonuclease P protein component [Marinoscillum sp. 108]VXD21084.1 Ribonuclease P protein component [Marinoscillum sp. 108]
MTDSGQTTSHAFSFPKREKLTGKKDIEELFKNGSSFYLHPLLLKYRREEDSAVTYHRALFTVPKKNFKRAVRRNQLKRRMREAYRLHKSIIYQSPVSGFYQLAFVYLDKSPLPYGEIEDKLKKLLVRLESQHSKIGKEHPGEPN